MWSVVLNTQRGLINIHKDLCINIAVSIEEAQNIVTRGLEPGVYRRGTPSLTRGREEREKAMHFRR